MIFLRKRKEVEIKVLTGSVVSTPAETTQVHKQWCDVHMHLLPHIRQPGVCIINQPFIELCLIFSQNCPILSLGH